MHRILVVFGTRPEAIKMAPVIRLLREVGHIDTKVCITGQHKEMLSPVLELFEIDVDFDLDIMLPDQSLSGISARILDTLEPIIAGYEPDMVVVHGDTTSGFMAALSSFYHQIPVAHVEAGLRTGDLQSPWPEELNRKFIGSIAAMHFAPTEAAKMNLMRENVAEDSIHLTGNTVVDALYCMRDKIHTQPLLANQLDKQFEFLSEDKKLVLVTGHRRESYGSGFNSICDAIKELATKFEGSVEIVYPVHLNPNVKKPVNDRLGELANVHLIEPVNYAQFVYLMERSFLILTDSGGVQEEAPTFGKPVLVMRDKTEREEAIKAGAAILVGAARDSIVQHATTLLTEQIIYEKMSAVSNPYGDGHAAERIIRAITEYVEARQ